MRKILLVVVLGLSLIAWAGTQNITDTYVFQAMFRPWARTTAQLPTASAYAGYVAYDTTKGALTVSNGSAWVASLASLPSVSTTYDFPALSATNTASATDIQCARSWEATATGAVLGNRCIAAGINFGAGSVLPPYVHLTCTVTNTDKVSWDLCAQMNDGGTYNATDAGLTATILQ